MRLPEVALLDTSVVIRFFERYRDDQQPAADRVREGWLNDDIQLVLLDLLVYEFVNVVVRSLGHDEPQARTDVGNLFRLRMPMVNVDARLAAEAASLAVSRQLSGYDAAFLAAARSLGVALITADRRLYERGGADVVLLDALAS